MINNCKFITGQMCHPADPKEWANAVPCRFMVDPESCVQFEEGVKPYRTPSSSLYFHSPGEKDNPNDDGCDCP